MSFAPATEWFPQRKSIEVLELSRHPYSHLMGFFYRTIRMVDHGIKPCYIFDGKPPELKGGVVRRFPNRILVQYLMLP